MAVEARHLNLFPSHPHYTSEMLNPSVEMNVSNLHTNPAGMVVGGGAGFSPATDSVLPFYSCLAKTMNNQMTNPPLKDDSSGLTFNNVALPFTRKRPRDATVGEGTFRYCYDNSSLISITNGAAGKPAGRCGTVTGGAGSFSFLGEDFSLQMMQQQLEIDRLISLHMEKVRLELEERRRKQSRRIIGAIEEAISKKLRDREEQIDRIGKLNSALEERVKSLYLENQIWRDLAQTNEATVNALRSNLEQVLAQVNNVDRIRSGEVTGTGDDDAESCCGSSGDVAEEEQGQVLRWRKVSRTSEGSGGRTSVMEEEEERKKRMCRRCGDMESSVLVLPCRHLCLCTACGPTVDTCPICNSTKNASVHVNFS